MDTTDFMVAIILVFALMIISVGACGIHYEVEDTQGLDLGSVVTTSAEYEYLTNDSFTGVVVRRERGMDDPILTVRNRDGTERRIATEFLEPKR